MGPQNDEDSIPAIHAALDYGLNWIDTAALYGLGHSEIMVARAIQGRTPKPYIFTKCERVWDKEGNVGASLKAESIRRECEDSLRRLKVDAIDLYQIHWPEPDQDIEEGWTELARLKQEGKVRYIGVSNFDVAQPSGCYGSDCGFPQPQTGGRDHRRRGVPLRCRRNRCDRPDCYPGECGLKAPVAAPVLACHGMRLMPRLRRS